MPPGKEHEQELRQHIAVRDVEIVLEGRDVDVSIKLQPPTTIIIIIISNADPSHERVDIAKRFLSYVALDIFLPRHHRRLADLEPHLRRRVVEETAVGRVHAGSAGAARRRLRLIWVAIAGLWSLLRRRRRWRRAHHRHRRHMLRHRVVQGRRVRRRRIRELWSVHRGAIEMRRRGERALVGKLL